MFNLICDHIKYATNNGNLRSAITVFRQREGNNKDFRIWNAQILNYAGYEISETETIGDKAQIEFTKVWAKFKIQRPWKKIKLFFLIKDL